MQQIERGIYYENGYSGVTLGALVFPHGTILIDAPLRAEEARAWRSALHNLGSGGNRFLVNLDAHLDRTLGARALDTTIIAHQKTAHVFRNRPSIFKGQTTESGAEWEANNDVLGNRWAIPDFTFTHRMYFQFGGPQVILEHHPGPALGSIWVLIPEARVIFAGDTILLDQPPFLASADLPAWIESLELLLSNYKDYLLISGRGGPVASEAVHTQLKQLRNILKGLEKLAKRNAPPELTEGLILSLIDDMDLPPKQREHYTQRLRHGLFFYYARRYRPIETYDQD
ncbi:MAG TPA: MBL fold metallo-hydrolase [Anaerolineales bacterium]|nr:MBL fold metallo-hydrolase [Anaerolineales bacterium]